MNRRKVGPLGYDMVARYGLNDLHCILIRDCGPRHPTNMQSQRQLWGIVRQVGLSHDRCKGRNVP